MAEYLDPVFLSWPAVPESMDSWAVGEVEGRPYELWRHAENLLEGTPSREFRVDAIANLKRAISSRISMLSSLYLLREVPAAKKNRPLLEILSNFGIVRPTLLRHIMDLRNQIEHEDMLPPEEERCREFVEFVWYFLRSTESLLYGGCRGISFEAAEDHHGHPSWIAVENGPARKWKPEFRGWISPAMLSVAPMLGWLEFEVKGRFTEAESWIENFPNAPPELLEEIIARNSDILFVEGLVIGPEEALGELARRYFSARLAWPILPPLPKPTE
jgi:hypothetical protein